MAPRGHPTSERWIQIFLQSQRTLPSKKAGGDPQMSRKNSRRPAHDAGSALGHLAGLHKGPSAGVLPAQSRRGPASTGLWMDCRFLRARSSRWRPARDHLCPSPRPAPSLALLPLLFWLLPSPCSQDLAAPPSCQGQTLFQCMEHLLRQASPWGPADGVH